MNFTYIDIPIGELRVRKYYNVDNLAAVREADIRNIDFSQSESYAAIMQSTQ